MLRPPKPPEQIDARAAALSNATLHEGLVRAGVLDTSGENAAHVPQGKFVLFGAYSRSLGTTSAMRISSERLPAPIFAMTLARWVSTVLTPMPSSPAMILFYCPLSSPTSTSFSLGVNFASLSWVIRVSAWRACPSLLQIKALRTEASRASPSNGFSRKSNAPCFIACTAS